MKLVALLLATIAIGLVGCTNSRADRIEARVAALKYAFEHDRDTGQDRGRWLYLVDSDVDVDEVRRALTGYPVTDTPLKIERDGMTVLVDRNSGRRIADWRIKLMEEKWHEVSLEVGCVKGGLNGYGQIIVVKKKNGGWTVVSSTPTWIS